jgi:hypothetical protein
LVGLVAFVTTLPPRYCIIIVVVVVAVVVVVVDLLCVARAPLLCRLLFDIKLSQQVRE